MVRGSYAAKHQLTIHHTKAEQREYRYIPGNQPRRLECGTSPQSLPSSGQTLYPMSAVVDAADNYKLHINHTTLALRNPEYNVCKQHLMISYRWASDSVQALLHPMVLTPTPPPPIPLPKHV